MAENKSVEQKVLHVLEQMNEDLPSAEKIAWEASSPLVGDGGLLDSLGLANFLVQLEQELQEHYNMDFSLTDQDLMDLFEAGTATIRDLADLLNRKLNIADHA